MIVMHEAVICFMDAVSETGLVKIFVAMIKLLPWQQILACLILPIDLLR